MSVPASLDIDIFQGADFIMPIQMVEDDGTTPINLTSCSFRAQIREVASSEDVVVAFTTTIVDASLGKLKLSLSSTQTEALPVFPSSNASRTITPFCYDLFVTYANGTIARLLEGLANISPDVTRAAP